MTSISIFPLPIVAFPGGRFPLQIFEPRYLDLVKSSLVNDEPFGIVTQKNKEEDIVNIQGDEEIFGDDQFYTEIKQQNQGDELKAEIYHVGTTVKIVDFNQQNNGLLGIVCEGGSVFFAEEVSMAPNNLYISQIRNMPVEDDVPVPERYSALKLLVETLMEHDYLKSIGYVAGIDTDCENHDWMESTNRLSWQLAHLLPLTKVQKYRLLTVSNSLDRLEKIYTLIARMQSASQSF